MVTKAIRQIVNIDEEKCNGCGLCLLSCAEGALQLIDGKAKLISEKYCDGLGACLGECPEGAITIEEREVDGFDEEAVEQHLHGEEPAAAAAADELPCGCSSATVTQFERPAQAGAPSGETAAAAPVSRLSHWPVQLTLVPSSAPFLQGADLVLAADCVPFAYPGFHQDFLGDNALLVACPKLDDSQAHQSKLNEVLRQAGISSLTVVRMEVPCCSGLVHMARQAIAASGKDIPFKEVIIGVKGDRLSG